MSRGIENGGRKFASFLPMIYDNFSIFRTNCAFACGTRACILRRFLRMPGAEKWCPKFQKSFMLLANTPTRLCLLEFLLPALFFYELFGTYRNKYCLMKKVNDFAFKFAIFSLQNITGLDGKM